MLTSIRKKATTIIAYVLIGLLCISFALFGIQNYFLDHAVSEEVAVVNGTEISVAGYQSSLRSQEDFFRQQLGDSFDENMFQTDDAKLSVLNSLIDRILIDQATVDNKYTVSDQNLAEIIQQTPQFQVEGKFDKRQFQRVLAQNQTSSQQYQERIRQSTAFSLIRNSLRDNVSVSDKELNSAIQLLNQKRVVNYAKIPLEKFEVEIESQEIQTYYDANQEEFRTNDQVKLDYVELSLNEIQSSVVISDTAAQDYYDDNVDLYKSAEARKASHILIKPSSDSVEDDETALAKINDLIEQINNGADFAELAKEHSEDIGSGSRGGDLGLINPGVMVAPFEDGAFALETVGDISPAIKTQFGYHVIKLTELIGSESQPFEEVKAKVITALKRDEAQRLFFDKAEQLKTVAFENPDSLKPLVDEFDLTIKTTGWVTRETGAGIASEANVRDAAFSDALLNLNENSEPVELDDGQRLVIVRKNEFQESKINELENVKSNIQSLLKRQKQSEQSQALGSQLVDQLSTGDLDWETAVENNELESTTAAQQVKDSTESNERSILTEAFRQRRPEENQSTYNGTILNDEYYIYQLSEVIDFEEADFEGLEENVKNQIDQLIKSRFGQGNYAALIDTLREKADINIIQDRL